MRKPTSHTTLAHSERTPRQPTRSGDWTIVEPTLTAMLTPQQIAAEDARKPRKSPRSRRPQCCKVGYGYYPVSKQVVPSLRLRGRWLEEMGFAIGSTLQIEVRDGALVVRMTGKE